MSSWSPEPHELFSDNKAYPEEEMIWLGDLSGYMVSADEDGVPILEHRCGKKWPVWGAGSYLANIIVERVLPHKEEGCR